MNVREVKELIVEMYLLEQATELSSHPKSSIKIIVTRGMTSSAQAKSVEIAGNKEELNRGFNKRLEEIKSKLTSVGIACDE